jgi:hypothetical protein
VSLTFCIHTDDEAFAISKGCEVHCGRRCFCGMISAVTLNSNGGSLMEIVLK